MEPETELTQLHGRVIEALVLLGFDRKDEHLIEIDGEEFQLDTYLPDYHVCIEADGPSHGMRGKKDKRRDMLLLEAGIPTLRVRWELVAAETTESLACFIGQWVAAWVSSIDARRAQRRVMNPLRRVPREPCVCPDDCPRHKDIGSL